MRRFGRVTVGENLELTGLQFQKRWLRFEILPRTANLSIDHR